MLLDQPRLIASLHLNVLSTALCVCFGLLGSGCVPHQATKADDDVLVPDQMLEASYSDELQVPFVLEPTLAMADGAKQAIFKAESASRRTREMADWVVRSSDNHNLPFAIVDKVNAKVYVFSVDGQLQGAAPVLLGLSPGDHATPGVGSKRMSLISPAERTTPAGRFVAKLGHNSHGKEILWVDYENAISLHPVITSRPKERRVERLLTPTPLDNRISYGCINVPGDFFRNVIYSNFSGTEGIVYILPEAKHD